MAQKEFNPRAHRIELIDGEHSMFFPLAIAKKVLVRYGSARAMFDVLEAMVKDGGLGFSATDVDDFLELLAFGFLHEDPEMTGAKLEKLCSIGDLEALGTTFGKAFSGSMPEQKAEGKGNFRAARR